MCTSFISGATKQSLRCRQACDCVSQKFVIADVVPSTSYRYCYSACHTKLELFCISHNVLQIMCVMCGQAIPVKLL